MNYLDVRAESSAPAPNERRNLVRFSSPAGQGEIFWDFAGDFLPIEPPDLDHALVALLPYCMCRGLDVRVHGALTRGLVAAVEECMDVWTLWRPELFRHRVAIEAETWLDDTLPRGRDAVLTFSGGVDATFALAANNRRMIGRRSVDVVAGIMIHGFDLPLERVDWFDAAAEHAGAILQEQNVAFGTVRTNWREFCPDWAMGHGFGLHAVLHQFHGRTSGGVLAADMDYQEMLHAWGNNSLANLFLSSFSFPIQMCGAGYTRTEKVASIARFPAVRSHVRVCWEHPEIGGNCGECEKCVRTQLNFLAAGVEDLPAFPRPLTPETILRISCKNEGQRHFLRDPLGYGKGVLLPPEIRTAVERVLEKPLKKPNLLRMLRERLRIRHRLKYAFVRGSA